MDNQIAKPIALEVHDLTVSYNRKPVLWDIDLSMPEGVMAAIIGPNGAGKSTLLKSIMGLLPLSSGYVKLFGQDFSAVRGRIAYVPQRESVDWDFPASVSDIVMMGRYGKIGLFRRPGKADQLIVSQCLEQVGMGAFSKRQISQLSGGQQQRVFLARALAQQADFYILDEPFAGVDAATEQAIVDVLHNMRNEGKTILAVHHDLQTAGNYFNWAILLNLHITAAGPADEVLNPTNLQKTYGSKLSLLAQVGDQLQKERFPLREKP
jgi:manganese/zinc/iron transport system ATP- binding protein